MLELKNIKKEYVTGAEVVNALNGINLQFRKNEFVSILGPSGCGKTTMLNIIGGLDQYTSGDLLINGQSTKEYHDRDWDRYRNHSIGFVFQSYNLIPHQSVLQNVELALTLSGVGKKERRHRAIEALEKVGLHDQIKKKPSEMSGGQMQRVAIARAIVNNPDIILADEPTGALDTETSVQVMQILKEISKDRLVIMVTHNPDLANTYSTRIVRMIDGLITSDSSPLAKEELEIEEQIDKVSLEQKAKKKNPSMKFHTSFGLSLKNLISKRGRTILTSFAGSIGIIGIALIYAVSHGTTNYIDSVQEQTLASYPITIEKENISLTSLLESFMGKAESIEEHDTDAIYQKAMLYELLDSISNVETKENDLKSFKSFIDKELENSSSTLSNSLNSVQYGYNINLTIYTENVDGEIMKADSGQLVLDIYKEYFGIDMSQTLNYSSSMMRSMMSSQYNLFKEMLSGKDGEIISRVTEAQYDVIYGRWPQRYDEMILFVDENNEIDDMTLYALGLTSSEDIKKLAQSALSKEEVDYEIKKFSYEEICSRTYRSILASDCYNLDTKTNTYIDLKDTDGGIKYLFDNGIDLKIVGIARPSNSSVRGSSGYVGYTNLLTKYIIEKAYSSAAAIAQINDPNTDIFTNLPFKSSLTYTDEEKADLFIEYVNDLTIQEKTFLYMRLMANPSQEEVDEYVNNGLQNITKEEIQEAIVTLMTRQMGLDEATIREYISNMSDAELESNYAKILEQQFRTQYSTQVAMRISRMSSEEVLTNLNQLLEESEVEELASMYDDTIAYSSSTYESNLVRLGCFDLDTPSTISMYAKSFSDKTTIEGEIVRYNLSVEEDQRIEYNDYIGIIMSSITTIINAISYVLIAFVSVSLVVSSIMIGVITLISVQERTKEIGILRAIGASKKNVSSLFNAETIIIGFNSGLIGVLVTYLLCIPINLILHALTDIESLSAVLPIRVAIILIIISLLLTLIAGIIPSSSAAKKDPVIALRTE